MTAITCFRQRIHYVYPCFRRCGFGGIVPLFYTFPSNFRLRKHVFPQALTRGILAETRENVPETSQFHVSVNVIGCNYCGNTSLRVGNWCFQVISIVKKALFTILGEFSRHLQLQKPILSTFLLHKIIPQQSFQVLSLFFLLPKLTIRSSYGIYSLHWLS